VDDRPSGTVTFLFTDIEGSTNLARTLGERWPAVLQDHHQILRDAIQGHQGAVVRTEGDAFFAVFSSAVDAVGAVVQAQRELAGFAWPPDGEVRVRMGLHTGEGRLDAGEYVGLDVHRAARIAAAGHGGQVLASSTTAALVAGALPAGAAVRDLGPHRLKDFDEPQPIHQLVVDGLPSVFAPLRTLDVPTNLPLELTSFVGRESELARVIELMDTTRLLTLTGAGGSGKTRLAQRAARDLLERFPDGVFFVELAPIREPALVPGAIASAVGARELGPRQVMEVLRIELRDRTMLIVLDNFEQVIDAASVVSELLAAVPGIRFLVTSRGPLHLRGERELPVPPLDLPDAEGRTPEELMRVEAVALFADRAAAVDPSFVLDADNVGAVADICRRLDGLPLAIELAASRVRLLSPAAIRARLDRALPLLEAGSRELPDRQRTLRGAIAWSYELLAEPTAGLFRRASVFSGGFDLDAVTSVCDPEGELGIEALTGVEALLDAGLLRRRTDPLRELRFDMLQTVREFGTERLAEAGEADDVSRRHARHYLELAEALEPGLRGPDLERDLTQLQMEHDNLRAALAWALSSDEGEVALRMVGAVWRFWHLHGDLSEGRRWTKDALALPSGAARTLIRARAVVAGAALAYWQHDVPPMSEACREAMDLFDELGDPAGIAEGMYHLAFSLSVEGDLPGAAATFRSALQRFQELGNLRGVADALFGLSIACRLQGDLVTAQETAEESLRLHRERMDPFGIYGSLFIAGRAAAELGDLETSRRQILEALGMAIAFGDRTGMALTLDNLADEDISRGLPERAMRLAGAAEAIKEVVGGQAPPELIHLPDPRERARPLLSHEAIEAAWNEGRAMTVEEALEYARGSP